MEVRVELCMASRRVSVSEIDLISVEVASEPPHRRATFLTIREEHHPVSTSFSFRKCTLAPHTDTNLSIPTSRSPAQITRRGRDEFRIHFAPEESSLPDDGHPLPLVLLVLVHDVSVSSFLVFARVLDGWPLGLGFKTCSTTIGHEIHYVPFPAGKALVSHETTPLRTNQY
jgi:hypothetical protein